MHLNPAGNSLSGIDSTGRREPGKIAGHRREHTRQDRLEWGQPEEPAALSSEFQRIELDPHLEEEEHDADVCKEEQLLTLGYVAGGEWRNEKTDREVADDGWQTKASGNPAGDGCRQEDKADFKNGRCCRFHSANYPQGSGAS